MEFIILKDYEEMSAYAANLIKERINAKPNMVLGLATGSTPEKTYENLIEMNKSKQVSFKDIKSVNLDEYIGISGDHDQSYRYFMNKNLFDQVDIDKNNTYVPNGVAEDLEAECKDYEKQIDDLGGIDLQILGIGTNAHIGFNEPAARLDIYTHVTDLTEETIEANSRFFESKEDVPTKAVSMGIGSIFKAEEVILLASGENKAKAIKALKNDFINTMIPASMLKLHPNVKIIVDEAAASLISE